METQEILTSKSNVEKNKTKNGAGGIRLPDFRLYKKILSSKPYGTGTKKEI